MLSPIALPITLALALSQAPGAPTSRPAKPPREHYRGFAIKTISAPGIGPHRYAVRVPPGYDDDPRRRWPVVVFLHGSGEVGHDGIRQLKYGLPAHVLRDPKRFPFILVVPQAKRMWFGGVEAAAVWAELAVVHADYRTDPDRVYLTGQSMGGFGTWELAAARPDVFAAIVPVCGQAPIEYLSNIVHLPVWAFHGAQDVNVPVAGSRDAIAELRRLGGRPRYSEYPDLAHVSWDRAYAEQELWPWLLAQRRAPAPRMIDYRLSGGIVQVWWLAMAADPRARAPASIRASIDETGRVEVKSENVLEWAVVSKEGPLKPGDAFEAIWNGRSLERGRYTGLYIATQDDLEGDEEFEESGSGEGP